MERFLLVKTYQNGRLISPLNVVKDIAQKGNIRKNASARNRTGLVRVNNVLKDFREAQSNRFRNDLVIYIQKRDGPPIL